MHEKKTRIYVLTSTHALLDECEKHIPDVMGFDGVKNGVQAPLRGSGKYLLDKLPSPILSKTARSQNTQSEATTHFIRNSSCQQTRRTRGMTWYI